MLNEADIVDIIAQDIYEYVEFLIDECKEDPQLFVKACKQATKKIQTKGDYAQLRRKAS